jgi:uncharacterized protein (TIGR03437 family)
MHLSSDRSQKHCDLPSKFLHNSANLDHQAVIGICLCLAGWTSGSVGMVFGRASESERGAEQRYWQSRHRLKGVNLLIMRQLITLALLCASLSALAFGQDASANTIVGMGYQYPPVAVAPGQLITVFVAGNVQGNITAAVSGKPTPVIEVRPASGCPAATLCSSVTAVTIQIPYEIEPACDFTNPACLVLEQAQLVVTANGVAGAPIELAPVADRIHFLTACDTLASSSGAGSSPYNELPCSPMVTHADGSMVTAGSPAQGGELLVAYAVGLGLTTPAVETGQAATTPTPTYETFVLDFNFRPNALATQPVLLCSCPATVSNCTLPCPVLPVPLYSGLTPGFVGLYQVNFMVPQAPVGTPACSGTVKSNLTVSVGGQSSFDGVGICVAPPQ